MKTFADMIMKFLLDEDFVSGMILKTILCFIFYGVVYVFFIFSWAVILQLYTAF